MAKKVVGYIKLQVPGRQGEPVAADRPGARPARSQHHGVLQGVQRPDPGHGAGPRAAGGRSPRYADKSFTFILKTPPASVLIKKALKLEKGSSKPHLDKVGKLTRGQVEEIAKAKQRDLTGADLEAAVRTVAGTARSMGITVEGVV